MNTRKLILILFLISVVVGLIGLATNKQIQKACCLSSYKTFNSPHSGHRVEVFKLYTPFSMMPGSTGDSPGYVRLFSPTGDLLNEERIEMVQLVETVEWSSNQMSIKFIADWNFQ